MKAASFALVNFLRNSATFIKADLYTVTLATGDVHRWTSGPSAIMSGGYIYSSLGPLLSRGKARVTAKLEVSSMDVTMKGTARIGTITVPAAAANGIFDGARVKVTRVVMPTYGDTTLGEVDIFEGRVSSVQPSRTQVVLTVKSDLEILNTPWPRNLVTPGCSHTLYDGGCGVVRASYAVSGVATGGTLTSIAAPLGRPAGWFDMGVIQFISGPLAGVTRNIKAWDGSTLTLSLPLPGLPAGCGFTVVPGCDKTKATCQVKFQNLARFRGCPYVPKPEAVR